MNLKNALRELRRYPSAIFGLLILLILILVGIYAIIAIPYDEAVTLWRGGVGVWDESPRLAAPAWTNLFRRNDLPETMVMNTKDGTAEKVVEERDSNTKSTITFDFDYPYQGFPQDLTVLFDATYTEKQPHATLTWIKPDGTQVNMGSFSVTSSTTYYLSQDQKLQRKLKGLPPHVGLFIDPDTIDSEEQLAMDGPYQLKIEVFTFDENSDVDAKMVIYGQVQGIAGTDHNRRDLSIALLWGIPIALSFGLLAALGTTITTMVIAAIGTWFGGWVDGLIQRVTEVNLVLPFLPILIMVGTFYSRSIWLMLGVTILLSIFGGSIKNYRAIFLQVKESSYIEAAQAYGASSSRIIFSYLTPRIIPLIIPQLVVLIPSFVFLEASLAVLGLGDPVLPTWGKIINDAQANGALYQGYYYWVIEPAVLLMITGLSFSLLGFALDRVFNPRLRGM